ncbi:MAG: hypothetical protein WEB88_16845 [Gemmatimonadota bacterium]
MRTPQATLLIVGLTVITACEPELVPLPDVIPLRPYVPPDPATAAFHVTDSAGVTVVHNGAFGAWGSALIEPTKVRTIGVREGDTELALSDISDIALRADGDVLVAAGARGVIHEFDAEGAFVRVLGGEGHAAGMRTAANRGGGPGEFIVVESLWLAGDTLVALDPIERRTTAFDGQGQLLATWSDLDGREWVRPVTRGPAGWIAEVGRAAIQLPPGSPARPPLPPARRLHVFDSTSVSAGELVLEIPMQEQYPATEFRGSYELPLFAVAPAVAFDARGRIYVTSSTGYQVDVHAPTGALLRRITRDHEPVPVGPGDVDRLLAFVEDVMARDSVLRAYSSFLARNVTGRAERGYDATLPPLGRMLVDSRGAFWVERADAPEPGLRDMDRLVTRQPLPLPTRWDLFDGEGRFLGTVETPPYFYGMAVDGAEITGVERDEYLVEYVVTYRAARPGGS